MAMGRTMLWLIVPFAPAATVGAACMPLPGPPLGDVDAGSYDAATGRAMDGGSDVARACAPKPIEPSATDQFFRASEDPSPGWCSDADLAKLEGKSAEELIPALESTSPTCKACALTIDGDNARRWAPVVLIQLAGNRVVLPNWGACVAGKSTPSCGEVEQRRRVCGSVACGDCSDNTFLACEGAASDGPTSVCSELATSLRTRTGCDLAAYQAATAACGDDIVRHIKGHCGDP